MIYVCVASLSLPSCSAGTGWTRPLRTGPFVCGRLSWFADTFSADDGMETYPQDVATHLTAEVMSTFKDLQCKQDEVR